MHCLGEKLFIEKVPSTADMANTTLSTFLLSVALLPLPPFLLGSTVQKIMASKLCSIYSVEGRMQTQECAQRDVHHNPVL